MKFCPALDPERYEAFVSAHPLKSHFMQSTAWGAFNALQRGYKPHYVGVEDAAGQLIAATLLLEHRLPVFPCYLYAPRGYVLDFSDTAALAAMTAGVRALAQQLGAMFVAIDPDIERRAIDAAGNPVPGGFDNSAVIHSLLDAGYVHRGFNLSFEGRQPRFTFRIDLTRDQSDIDAAIVGNVLKNVRKSGRYAVTVTEGTAADIPDLYRLVTLTGSRDNFVAYSEEYYRNFFESLDAHDMVTLWIGTCYPAETVAMLAAEKAALLEKRKQLKKQGPLQESILSEQRLDHEIALFGRYADRYPDGIRLCAHLVVRYGDKAWAVHAGSDNVLSETFLNNRVYYDKLCAAKQNGAKLLDQFGTVGSPDNSPLKSLHEFKRQFGGRYIEFIGEFDLVVKPFWFFLYEKVLPLYRGLRINLKMALRGKRRTTE